MFGVTGKYNKLKGNPHFIRFKDGAKFVVYCFGIYLATTFFVGCLGVMIGSPFLMMPLAILISNPVVWVIFGIALMATYKMAVEPLFHLAKEEGTELQELGKLNKEKKLTRSTSVDSLTVPDNAIKNERTRSLSLNDLDTISGSLAKGNQEKPKTPDRDVLEVDKESEKDLQSRASSLDSKSSYVSSDGGYGSDSESTKTKITGVKTYDTAGAGNNCFFHSVFGSNNSGTYRVEKAQEMRLEWYKFLSQFEHLDDYKMSKPLRSQLQTVFNGFLLKPDDLTGESDKIKELVAQTNKKIKEADDKVKELKDQIVKNFRDNDGFRKRIYTIIGRTINQRNDRCPNDKKPTPNIQDLLDDEEKLYNEIGEDLKSCVLMLNSNLSKEEYDNTYDPEVIKDSFINNHGLYKAYLEAIKGEYQVFIEEIPILASLAGIKIEVYREDNDIERREVFEPNAEMMVVLDKKCNDKTHPKNNELWGNKKQETIYLKPGHYERAEIVEVEHSFWEKASSALQGTVAVCASALGLTNT